MEENQLLRKILNYFHLDAELEDPDVVFEEIKKGIVFKGTNLWILIFAIIVASVGLNMNSTAVIIGAMLISPLMGPINGMGYSIATYDFELFKKSVKNYSFAIVAGLLASTAYFALSPVSTAYSELLARTNPTIYDVFIALFGGLAGIVAISSKQKGNVIPGVAIATALIPPLCTAGYGLATDQLNFFFGAFYLFTINTIFIALAAVLVSQLLKFPIRTIVDPARRARVNRFITLVIIIVLLPSIYFGYKLVQQEKFNLKATAFIENVTIIEGNYLLKHYINTKKNMIRLVYGGSTLSDGQKKIIKEKANNFNLNETTIEIEQGLSFTELDQKNLEMLKLKEEILQLQDILQQKNLEIDSIKKNKFFGYTLLNEIKPLYPQIHSCFYADSYVFTDSIYEPKSYALIHFKVSEKLQAGEKEKITNWLKKRLKSDDVFIYFEYTHPIERINTLQKK